jgi:hypothetical protein
VQFSPGAGAGLGARDEQQVRIAGMDEERIDGNLSASCSSRSCRRRC